MIFSYECKIHKYKKSIVANPYITFKQLLNDLKGKLNTDCLKEHAHYFNSKKIDNKKTLFNLGIRNGSTIKGTFSDIESKMFNKYAFVLLNTDFAGKTYPVYSIKKPKNFWEQRKTIFKYKKFIFNSLFFTKPVLSTKFLYGENKDITNVKWRKRFIIRPEYIFKYNNNYYRYKKNILHKNTSDNIDKHSTNKFLKFLMPITTLITGALMGAIFKNWYFLIFSLIGFISIINFSNPKIKLDVDITNIMSTCTNNIIDNAPKIFDKKLYKNEKYYFCGDNISIMLENIILFLYSKGADVYSSDIDFFKYLHFRNTKIDITNKSISHDENSITFIKDKMGIESNTFFVKQILPSIYSVKIGLNKIKYIQTVGKKTLYENASTLAEQQKVEIKQKTALNSNDFTNNFSVPVGFTYNNKNVCIDFKKDTSHLLIAGTTGSGKSVILKTILIGLANKNDPKDVVAILIDHKGGETFNDIKELKHIYNISTDLNYDDNARTLKLLYAELKRREMNFNKQKFPELFVFIDEFQELLKNTDGDIKSIESIATLGRSLGVHLIIATQKPAGIISKTLLANIGVKIAFKTTSINDSIDVIDKKDAYYLQNQGDGILLNNHNNYINFHGITVSKSEPIKSDIDNNATIYTKTEKITFDSKGALNTINKKYSSKADIKWNQPLTNDIFINKNDFFAIADVPEKIEQFGIKLDTQKGNIFVNGSTKTGKSTALLSLSYMLIKHGHTISIISKNIEKYKMLLAFEQVKNIVDVHDKRLVKRCIFLCNNATKNAIIFDDFDEYNAFENPLENVHNCFLIISSKNVNSNIIRHYPQKILFHNDDIAQDFFYSKKLEKRKFPGEAIYLYQNESYFIKVKVLNKILEYKNNNIKRLTTLPKNIKYTSGDSIAVGGDFATKIKFSKLNRTFGIYGLKSTGKTNLIMLLNKVIKNSILLSGKTQVQNQKIYNLLNDNKTVIIDDIDKYRDLFLDNLPEKSCLIASLNPNSYTYNRVFSESGIIFNAHNIKNANELFHYDIESYADSEFIVGRGVLIQNNSIKTVQTYKY
jgi:energy-coupling factor transporter ATP-binding protein EcfA2